MMRPTTRLHSIARQSPDEAILFDFMKKTGASSKSISELHREKTGKISDKWECYLPFYDRLLATLRDLPVSLLEIGVDNGGSLETWAAYFRNAEHIVGCDINPQCKQLRYDDARIRVIVDNVNDEPGYRGIMAACDRFDIVIDDGSHYPLDIIQSFLRYFPHLKPGGIYVIEDSHSLYSFGWRDDMRNPVGCYAFFKRLIDLPNFQFWQDQGPIAEYLEDMFPDNSAPSFLVEGWIESLEFSNSLIVVRKAAHAGHDKLGQRIIAGKEALKPAGC